MTTFLQQLKEEWRIFYEDITTLNSPMEYDPISATEMIIPIMEKLRAFTCNYQFETPAAEIDFFKKVVPDFLSILIYHQKVYHLSKGTS